MICHVTVVLLFSCFQIDQEVAKLLELKAKLEDCAETAGGKFILKCPKVKMIYWQYS